MPTNGSFQIYVPADNDCGRIAQIHLQAMDSNLLLHVQFPTAASLDKLQGFLDAYTLEELKDPKVGILAARDASTNDVVSFAKWDYPSSDRGEDCAKLETGSLRNLEGCQREFLDRYAALAEEAKKKAFGDRPCYRLNFVCTDPKYQGLGAGSLLTRHVLMRAEADRMPVYLESTLNAVRLYEKLGFQKLDRFEMQIPRRGGRTSDMYEEVCMVWWPDERRDRPYSLDDGTRVDMAKGSDS